MAAVRVRLDHKGMAEMLKSAEVAAAVLAKAADVEVLARAHQSVIRHGMPVEVGVYETDRAAAEVTIAHAGGLAVEAKYGVLADAARVMGLDFNDKKGDDV